MTVSGDVVEIHSHWTRSDDGGEWIVTDATVATQNGMVVVDHLFRIATRATLIGVLDPEDELAAGLFRERIVEQRDVRGPDMRIARRRWCNSHTYLRHGAAL